MSLTLPNPTRPQKFGGIFDTIERYLNLGLQGYAAVQSVTGAGSGSGQARGLAAIQQKSGEVLAGLDQLLAAARQNPAQGAAIMQGARELAATLDNPAFFYQAKKGQDAEVLRNAKAAAASKVQQIEAVLTGSVTGGQLVTTNASGQLVSTPANITPANGTTTPTGALNEYLPFIALGVVALIILKR